MKKLTLPILAFIFTVFTLSSCKKCKECYFVEEGNGTRTEQALGEFCDDDIETKENEEFICIDGSCFIECR